MNQALFQYQNVELTTADKGRIVILLYKGAIRFAKQAKLYLDAGDVTGKCERLNRTVAIISELAAHLDLERGDSVAENLLRLYHYMLGRLTEANSENDPLIIDEVVRLLETLLEGWLEVCREGVRTQTRRAEPPVAALAGSSS